MTDTVAILERLVAFDTTSSKSNLELIEYVQAYLDGVGAPVRRVYDLSGQKAALHAVIGDRRAWYPELSLNPQHPLVDLARGAGAVGISGQPPRRRRWAQRGLRNLGAEQE